MRESMEGKREKQQMLLDDYDRFRQLLIHKDITIGRKEWQPMVILEKHWPNSDLMGLLQQLKRYPQLDINTAIELKSYKNYFGDLRFLKGSFADITKFTTDPLLILFYPRDYNSESLTLELYNLERVIIFFFLLNRQKY
jgi:hypothetical protein